MTTAEEFLKKQKAIERSKKNRYTQKNCGFLSQRI